MRGENLHGAEEVTRTLDLRITNARVCTKPSV